MIAWLLTGCTSPDVVSVRADQGWQDTGFEVQGGQPFSIDYVSGKWTAWFGTVPSHDAEGTAYICGDAERCCEPIADFRKEALIGKVGDELFPIGNGGTFTPSSSGTLYLRMNDCDGALADNRGSVKVRIEP